MTSPGLTRGTWQEPGRLATWHALPIMTLGYFFRDVVLGSPCLPALPICYSPFTSYLPQKPEIFLHRSTIWPLPPPIHPAVSAEPPPGSLSSSSGQVGPPNTAPLSFRVYLIRDTPAYSSLFVSLSCCLSHQGSFPRA